MADIPWLEYAQWLASNLLAALVGGVLAMRLRLWRSLPELLLHSGLLALVPVLLLVTVAGYTVGFSTLLLYGGLLLVLVVGYVWPTRGLPAAELLRLRERFGAWRQEPFFFRAAVLLGGLGLLALGGLAAFQPPTIFDDVSYRLPRAVFWLEANSLRHFPSFDPRMNYLTAGPELIYVWWLGMFANGWPHLGLVQWFCGVLVLLAQWSWGRRLGLPRWAVGTSLLISLSAVPFLLQFLTCQSDLFAAALVLGGLVLAERALAEKRGLAVAGLVLGVGLASKFSTVFAAPLIALLGLRWLWRSRPPLAEVGRGAVAVAAGFLLLAGPRLLENASNFGHPLGPADHRSEFAMPLDPRLWAEKLGRDFASHLEQNAAEEANPPWPGAPWLRSFVQGNTFVWRDSSFGSWDGRLRTERDYDGWNLPSTDLTGVGLLLFPGSWLVWLVMNVANRQTRKLTELHWMALGTVGFAVAVALLNVWHEWLFRFYVLVVPVLALLWASAIAQLPPKINVVGATMLTIAGLLQVLVTVGCPGTPVGWDQASFGWENRDWRPTAHGEQQLEARPTILVFPATDTYQLALTPLLRHSDSTFSIVLWPHWPVQEGVKVSEEMQGYDCLGALVPIHAPLDASRLQLVNELTLKSGVATKVPYVFLRR